MPTFISILRGINVSGQKMIKMAVLKEVYENIGFQNVQTYIQSGNVVFNSENPDNRELELKISQQIFSSTGFEVPVIVLGVEELKDMINKNPFISDNSKDISFLHVTVLSDTVQLVTFDKMNEKKSNGEEFAWIGRAIYLYCPGGYGRTKLTNTFFENILKVTATTRNWKTTLELLRIAESFAS